MAHILIIDDDVQIRDLISLVLSMDDHTVVAAADGSEALKLFAHPRAKFDLVITDILMPNKDGIETIIELTSVQKKQTLVPIVAMSGGRGTRLTSEFNLGTAQAIAKVHILKKPFSRDEVLEIVNVALNLDSSCKPVS